jgi:hypothetical protein
LPDGITQKRDGRVGILFGTGVLAVHLTPFGRWELIGHKAKDMCLKQNGADYLDSWADEIFRVASKTMESGIRPGSPHPTTMHLWGQGWI